MIRLEIARTDLLVRSTSGDFRVIHQLLEHRRHSGIVVTGFKPHFVCSTHRLTGYPSTLIIHGRVFIACFKFTEF